MRKNQVRIAQTYDQDILVGEIKEMNSSDPITANVRIDKDQPYETTPWEVYTTKVVGNKVGPSADNNHEYVCIVAGMTGDTEPHWVTDGGVIIDGGVLWRDTGVYDLETWMERVPFFYHCSPGNTEGGASAFHEGDRVLLAKASEVGSSRYYIVGFEDLLPRACEYYLRLTFNGFTPALGGEEITVSLGEDSESNIVEPGGLCGPFMEGSGTGEEQIFLNNGALSKYFTHYFEVPVGTPGWAAGTVKAEGDLIDVVVSGISRLCRCVSGGVTWDIEPVWPSAGSTIEDGGVLWVVEGEIIHFNIQFTEVSGHFSLEVQKVALGAPDIDLNAVLVRERLHDIPLGSCVKTTEIIDSKSYVVYLVDFTNLNLLYRSESRMLEKDPHWSDPCSLVCDTAEYISPEVCDQRYVREVSKEPSGYCPNVSGYEIKVNLCPPCVDSYYDHALITTWGSSRWLPSDTFAKENICILSDLFGCLPAYTAPELIFTRSITCNQGCYRRNIFGSWILLYAIYSGTIDYSNDSETEFSMALTPESRF
ncbi:MAG: hypothetical protein EHM49_00115 [Deltaproteobacteria bacterium]|nr:MAG: hypothetical protein EHM49_00115 [Deltaproteobacteria bacterium]